MSDLILVVGLLTHSATFQLSPLSKWFKKTRIPSFHIEWEENPKFEDFMKPRWGAALIILTGMKVEELKQIEKLIVQFPSVNKEDLVIPMSEIEFYT